MDKMNQWILVCLLLYNHGKYSSVKCGITCDPKPPCGCELSDGSANIDLSPMQSHATPMYVLIYFYFIIMKMNLFKLIASLQLFLNVST